MVSQTLPGFFCWNLSRYAKSSGTRGRTTAENAAPPSCFRRYLVHKVVWFFPDATNFGRQIVYIPIANCSLWTAVGCPGKSPGEEAVSHPHPPSLCR